MKCTPKPCFLDGMKEKLPSHDPNQKTHEHHRHGWDDPPVIHGLKIVCELMKRNIPKGQIKGNA
jgi:hypothetical protein